jgi:hypothetical protein
VREVPPLNVAEPLIVKFPLTVKFPPAVFVPDELNVKFPYEGVEEIVCEPARI